MTTGIHDSDVCTCDQCAWARSTETPAETTCCERCDESDRQESEMILSDLDAVVESVVMNNELSFLRGLEQDVQYLHRRILDHYTGNPETAAIKLKIDARIIELLERETR